MLNISLGASQPFNNPQLIILCLALYLIFCIHSFVEGHLGSFQLLAIINKVTMSIVKHVSLLQVGASSGYMPRSGIA